MRIPQIFFLVPLILFCSCATTSCVWVLPDRPDAYQLKYDSRECQELAQTTFDSGLTGKNVGQEIGISALGGLFSDIITPSLYIAYMQAEGYPRVPIEETQYAKSPSNPQEIHIENDAKPGISE